MDQYGNGRQATWTSEVVFPRNPTWEILLAQSAKSYRWLKADPDRSRDSDTEDGSCLVATLCFPYQGEFYLFQCTIPRGDWHTNMLMNGPTKARTWWAAARPSQGSRTILHAEDGVEFLAENTMNELWSQDDDLRIIVYGSYMREQPRQVNLCRQSNKRPPCVDVALTIHIRWTDLAARDQDEEDRRLGHRSSPPRGPPPGQTPGAGAQGGGRSAHTSGGPGGGQSGGGQPAGGNYGNQGGGTTHSTSRRPGASDAGLSNALKGLSVSDQNKRSSSSRDKPPSSSRDKTSSSRDKTSSSRDKTSSSKDKTSSRDKTSSSKDKRPSSSKDKRPSSSKDKVTSSRTSRSGH